MKQTLKTLKNICVISASFLLFTLTAQVGANCKEDTLEHRISSVGSVCVEGEECKSNTVLVAEAPKGPRGGKEIVADYCGGCHMSGVMNAPKIGSSFKALGSRGVPDLVKSAQKGKNAMPRNGGCNDCSTEELSAAIQEMLK